MPWLRAGDNAATHPMVLRVAPLGGNVNEVFGFVARCALQSAGHTTDYVIDQGTAWMLGGPDTPRLLELAVAAGYFVEIQVDGINAYKLVEDPEFLHMKLRSELDWEKQQRADTSNPLLTVPVRHRDGDACRYCRMICNWKPGARKGKLAGTYDHRAQPATVDTMVVACGSCNPARRDDPDADERLPLLPAPEKPYYSKVTAEYLARHGVIVEPTEDLRPGTYPDGVVRPEAAPGAAPDTAPTRQRPSKEDTAAPVERPAERQVQTGSADNLQNAPRGSADPADSRTRARTPAARAPGRDGSGREEHRSGRAGSGSGGSAAAAARSRKRRRGKRGGRGRPSSSGGAK